MIFSLYYSMCVLCKIMTNTKASSDSDLKYRRCFVSEEELFHAIEEIRSELDIPLYLFGKSNASVPHGYISWDDLMLNAPGAEICKSLRSSYTLVTPCIYIFTSGTTGNISFIQITCTDSCAYMLMMDGFYWHSK